MQNQPKPTLNGGGKKAEQPGRLLGFLSASKTPDLGQKNQQPRNHERAEKTSCWSQGWNGQPTQTENLPITAVLL